MALSLIGLLITAGIVAIFIWALLAILAAMGIAIPGVVKIVVAAAVGILLLLLLAVILGAPIGFRAIG